MRVRAHLQAEQRIDPIGREGGILHPLPYLRRAPAGQPHIEGADYMHAYLHTYILTYLPLFLLRRHNRVRPDIR